MSLTSLLQRDAEVRARFREVFEIPAFTASPTCVAPLLEENPRRVGTAFDYLLRFHARRLNPDLARGRAWVAEAAVGRLEGSEREKATCFISEAEAARDEYVASGRVTFRLLESVLRLASLEPVGRAAPWADLSTAEVTPREELDDLRQLLKVVPEAAFTAGELCLLNPTFGKASGLVGGVDADLVIDGTIIDIKTIREARFTRRMFDQLLGYYTLHIIGGIGEVRPKPEIERIAVYFSRHAYLHVLDLGDIIDRVTFPDFVENFAVHCLRRMARHQL